MLLEGSFPPTPKADSLLYFGHGRRKKGCRAHHASHLHSGSPHQDSTVKFQPRDRNNTCETTEPPSCLLSMEKIWSSNVSWESFRSPASPRWRDEQCSMTIFCTRWVCLNMSQEKKIHWFPTQLAILCGCLVRIVLETLRFGIMIQSVSKEFRTSQEVYSFYHQLYKASVILRKLILLTLKSWLNTHIQGTSLSVDPWNVSNFHTSSFPILFKTQKKNWCLHTIPIHQANHQRNFIHPNTSVLDVLVKKCLECLGSFISSPRFWYLLLKD